MSKSVSLIAEDWSPATVEGLSPDFDFHEGDGAKCSQVFLCGYNPILCASLSGSGLTLRWFPTNSEMAPNAIFKYLFSIFWESHFLQVFRTLALGSRIIKNLGHPGRRDTNPVQVMRVG